MFELPTIMINFKTYEQTTASGAEKLVNYCRSVTDSTGVSITCCPQPADIYRCNQHGVSLLAQHIDVDSAGSHTGKLNIKSLQENGARGSLINHSEDRVSIDIIKQSIELLDNHDMLSVVCVKDVDEAKQVAQLGPDVIAIEPPELIGGDISVTTADPTIISSTVSAVESVNSSIPILCGAGVKTGTDVQKALELGARGVLIASGVTKAKDQLQALQDLASGVNINR
ncbi:MAG: triose-phosphate isomerase [Nanobdellota archaeon]